MSRQTIYDFHFCSFSQSTYTRLDHLQFHTSERERERERERDKDCVYVVCVREMKAEKN